MAEVMAGPVAAVLDAIRTRGGKVERSGDGWLCTCPAHEDARPSLSVGQGTDNRCLLKCHAGCTTEAICAALGIAVKDLFVPRDRPRLPGGALPSGEYTFRILHVKDAVTRGGDPSWRLKLLVTAGPRRGAVVFDTVSWGGKGLPHTKTLMAALGHDIGGDVAVVHRDVVGRTVRAKIESKQRGERAVAAVPYGGYRAGGEAAVYRYVDESGALLFEVVRYDPKDFAQRRPAAGDVPWAYDLKGVRRVPYRLQDLLVAPRGSTVVVVEGEKDADRLASIGVLATTCPQGAGKWGKMDAEVTAQALAGQDVAVIPDADEAGRAHAAVVARALTGVARTVRVLELPGVSAKGDVSDWLDAGGNRERLLSLVASTPEGLGSVAAARGSVRNFVAEEIDGKDGQRLEFHRLRIDEVARAVRWASDGWPRRLGDSIFVDLDGHVRGLEDDSALFGWLHSLADVSWHSGLDAEGESFVTRRELYRHLALTSEEVAETTEIPVWPVPSGIYITRRYRTIEDGDPADFYALLERFKPSTEIDQALVQALALTPFWGGPPGGRPFFVVTGPEGVGVQESGKTTLVELLAMPSGGVFRAKVDRGGDPISKQIVSDRALRHRVILFDNLAQGMFSSGELAELVTSAEIDGRPAHGHQRRRMNYLTWSSTAVSPQLDEDLASRSVVIHLDSPNRDKFPLFREEVEEFVASHRERIVAGALAVLRGEKVTIISRHSRFPGWDRAVLATHPAANDVLDELAARRAEVDARQESVALFLGELRAKAFSHGTGTHWEVSPKVIGDTWNEANGGQKTTVGWVIRKLREATRAGKLPTWLWPKYHRRHGSPWVVAVAEAMADGAGPGDPRTVEFDVPDDEF